MKKTLAAIAAGTLLIAGQAAATSQSATARVGDRVGPQAEASSEFAGIPLIGWLISIPVGIWLLFTGVVAIRQALDFGTGRALLTAVLGIIPYVILRAIIV